MPTRALLVTVALLSPSATPASGIRQTPAPPPSLALQGGDADRLLVYYVHIGDASASMRGWGYLGDVVRPVLALAAERSAEGDAVAENRAAILALALFTTGRSPTMVVPEARDWPRPAPRRLLLRNRHDLAQHFIVSAALAAAAGEPLAHALGVYKEVEDARNGSGFSFADLAADRAGTAFGVRATTSAASALGLQARVVTALDDADALMPAIDDLPEGLDEREFARRYRDGNAAAYVEQIAEIDRRIAALPVFRAARR